MTKKGGWNYQKISQKNASLNYVKKKVKISKYLKMTEYDVTEYDGTEYDVIGILT